MGGIFQRPVCDMGAAYDFAFRPVVGPPDADSGGPCDDTPVSVSLYAASSDPSEPNAPYARFSLCPGHTEQLSRYDRRLMERGQASRFVHPPS